MYLYIKSPLILLILYSFLICSPLYSSGRPESRKHPVTDEKNIIIVSDTQSPIWVEELFLSSDNNERARDSLFSHIVRSHPNAVFHLGDLVSLGFNTDSWITIDQFLSNLSKVQIPFYPTLGNHRANDFFR